MAAPWVMLEGGEQAGDAVPVFGSLNRYTVRTMVFAGDALTGKARAEHLS
ncbi:hypothetical protein HTV45_03800 [Streptomyces sp. CHD11]|nr:hypothetical protein [Streptomyces sp. CHD11]MBT3150029.1 hypothetical protein [Streptomyces sp. CHD11]